MEVKYTRHFIKPILLLGFLMFKLYSFGQEKESFLFSDTNRVVVKDIIVSKKDTVFTSRDTIIIVKNILVQERDTIITKNKIIYKNGHEFEVRYDSLVTFVDTLVTWQDTLLSRNERVLKEIKEFSQKKNIFSRLIKGVLIFEDEPPKQQEQSQGERQQTSQRYEVYEGKVIRDVQIKVLDVFGSTVNNPEKKAKSILEKGGNFLHIKTHPWVIRNRLLFKSGEKVNMDNLSESERLLRLNNFIYDAKVVVFDTLNKDSVDILVLVQDVWNISGGLGYDQASSAKDFSVQDANFFGLGHQVANYLRLEPSLYRGYNYRGYYNINNIYKTLSAANIYYLYELGQERYGAGINRDFITPAIKWGGGVNFSWNSLFKGIPTDTTEKINFRQRDYWLGHAFYKYEEEKYTGNRLIVAGRLIQTEYERKQNALLQTTNRKEFDLSNFFLLSTGYFKRSFYKDQYIFRLGRTEDIPEGHLISLTGGLDYSYKTGNFRRYYGVNTAWCRNLQGIGYFYLNAGMGAFNNKNRWEEGIRFSRFLYFTPLIRFGKWYWRNFLGIRYTEGINNSSILTINRENGLRGMNSGQLAGNSKFVVNFETNLFPYFNLVGFRIGILAFADLGWVAKEEKIFDKQNFFPGVGVGIRFRNEHLVFSMFQIYFTYYPNAHLVNQKNLQVFERTKFFYDYTNFEYSRPTTLPFY